MEIHDRCFTGFMICYGASTSLLASDRFCWAKHEGFGSSPLSGKDRYYGRIWKTHEVESTKVVKILSHYLYSDDFLFCRFRQENARIFGCNCFDDRYSLCWCNGVFGWCNFWMATFPFSLFSIDTNSHIWSAILIVRPPSNEWMECWSTESTGASPSYNWLNKPIKYR